MGKLYKFLKYFFITFWAVFVVAPFLWALTTSFKDFNSVNGGATYIPWVDFEPKLEGWKVLIKSPAKPHILLLSVVLIFPLIML